MTDRFEWMSVVPDSELEQRDTPRVTTNPLILALRKHGEEIACEPEQVPAEADQLENPGRVGD